MGEKTRAEEIRELLELVRQRDLEQMLKQPAPPSRQPLQPETIHYTELPEDTSGGPTAKEWNFYRREVGRLLAEGHEGKWVLIVGEEIIGMWDSWDEARAVALDRYLMKSVLIHQVRNREPVLRGPFLRLCRS
jgi:hypothetical protein